MLLGWQWHKRAGNGMLIPYQLASVYNMHQAIKEKHFHFISLFENIIQLQYMYKWNNSTQCIKSKERS